MDYKEMNDVLDKQIKLCSKLSESKAETNSSADLSKLSETITKMVSLSMEIRNHLNNGEQITM